MIKTVCDICGKEMDGHAYVERLKGMQFCISSYGKTWDICDECRGELDKWIKSKKEQTDGSDNS